MAWNEGQIVSRLKMWTDTRPRKYPHIHWILYLNDHISLCISSLPSHTLVYFRCCLFYCRNTLFNAKMTRQFVKFDITYDLMLFASERWNWVGERETIEAIGSCFRTSAIFKLNQVFQVVQRDAHGMFYTSSAVFFSSSSSVVCIHAS